MKVMDQKISLVATCCLFGTENGEDHLDKPPWSICASRSSGDVNGVEPVGAGEDSLAGLRVHGLPNISSSRYFFLKIILLLESIYINREEDKEALKEEAGINIKTILENIDDENKKQASLQETMRYINVGE